MGSLAAIILLHITPLVPAAQAAEDRLLGFSTHILSGSDRSDYVALARTAGARTVRDDISWASIERSPGVYDWSGPDELIARSAQNGLALLLLVDTTPGWARVPPGSNPGNAFWLPPAKATDYGTFARQVALRYGANGSFWASHPTVPKILPAGIEVWNEPNLSIFWGGLAPDPVHYTAMLVDAYTKIKQVDPGMMVVSAGLAPAGGYDDVDCNGSTDTGAATTKMNGLNFLQIMYESGAQGHLDAVGWHPYNFWNGASAAQALSYHLCSAWSQMQQTPVSALSLMAANGDATKTIWATELGAPSCIAGATYPCMAESEHGNLAAQALKLWRSYDWSGSFYWYDLRDDGGGTSTSDPEQHFGASFANNASKPAYIALHEGFSAAAGADATPVPRPTLAPTPTTAPAPTPLATAAPIATPLPSPTAEPIPTATPTLPLATEQPKPTETAVPTTISAVPAATVPEGPQATGNDILSGEVLQEGQFLRSSSRGRFVLVYQSDGNLVAYNRGNAYWASGTYGKSAGAVTLERDGTLAIFDGDGGRVWATPVAAGAGSRVRLLRDGRLVLVRADGSLAWSSNSSQP